MKTQQARSHRGVSTAGVVIAIVVVLGAGFAVAYFASDVFRTKTNEAYKQFSQWTPENIANDPVGYLAFCEEQTEIAIKKCKASEISIRTKLADIGTMHKTAKEKHELGTKALAELKTLYKAAAESNTFPLKWNGKDIDQDAAKLQIKRFAGDTKLQGDMMAKLDGALKQLTVQQTKLAEAKNTAEAQKEQIKVTREMVKVDQITEGLKKNLGEIGSAVQGSLVSIASAESGTMSLEDLAASKAATVSDEEFNKIMNEK